MQKITPFLWFENQAEEAVDFYAAIFKNSRIANVARYGEAGSEVSGRQKGSIMTVAFELEGQEFVALNGGPYATFTPAVSFFVNCQAPEEIDRLWEKLSAGGKTLMELDKYPFSDKYGWLEDKYGVSWQLNLGGRAQRITPSLMFVGDRHGKAEEAMNFYITLFKDSSIVNIERYAAGEGGAEGTVKYAVFALHGQEFMAMDSGMEHHFTFTPAISWVVNCESQQEVDALWDKLTDGGEIEQCGWLKDRYGVTWQIVPIVLNEMLLDKNPAKAESVMKAMLQMKKLDIKTLKQAYDRQ